MNPIVVDEAANTMMETLLANQQTVPQQAPADVVEAQPELGPIDSAQALCLYRITQEALRNVAKHADARHVHVSLSRREGQMQLSIADDGKGFDLAQVRQDGSGLGLRSIDERVRLASGELSIDSRPGQGTTLSVRLDVETPSADLAGV